MTPAVPSLPREIAHALGKGETALFTVFAKRITAHLGESLITVLAPDRRRGCLVRIYSNDTAQYPLGDADTIESNRWFRRLFAERMPVVANNESEIARWLPDFVAFKGAGLSSLANIPVVVAGQVIGIANLMSGPEVFTQERIGLLEGETPTAALGIMLSQVKVDPFAVSPAVLQTFLDPGRQVD
ncbi:GAF domain-containing protein [Chelativorans xinjiangense]|uniref:GAF domain-containing protein n=1 Tax=Chelativorans xinjiangense TaxID=2681485 RepID=UPI001359C49B|nr:GAF domain-containing protein [Chelativorans xinjiangense]